MPDQDKERTHKPQAGEEARAEDHKVRRTMDQTREVLEASSAEIERARRLLTETEKLIDRPGGLEAEGARDDAGLSEASPAGRH